MKLQKQSGLKAAVVALVAGLTVAFFGLIRANPGIEAEAEAAPSPTPDYGQFFAPNGSATPVPVDRPPPHTRSRAS